MLRLDSLVVTGADLRAGEAFPPAALPVGAWTRTPRVHHPPNAHTGQDLVPEPPVQDEARPAGEGVTPGGARRRGAGVTAEGRRAGTSARRQALYLWQALGPSGPPLLPTPSHARSAEMVVGPVWPVRRQAQPTQLGLFYLKLVVFKLRTFCTQKTSQVTPEEGAWTLHTCAYKLSWPYTFNQIISSLTRGR